MKEAAKNSPTSHTSLLYTTHKWDAFTLVELLVSVAVFALVMVGLVGAYLALLGGSAKARSQQELLDTLHAALQHMERLAAQAEVVACGRDLSPAFVPTQHQTCPTGANTLIFVLDRTTGRRVAFRFRETTLERTVDESQFAPLISPRLTILDGAFIVQGGSRVIAPAITVAIKGVIETHDSRRSTAPFALQTTFASPMVYDLPSGFGEVPPSSEGEGVIQCVFNDKPGFLVVNAGAGLKMDPIKNGDLFVLPARRPRNFFGKRVPWYAAPFRLSATSTIPAGTYDAVYAQGWDDHCKHAASESGAVPCPDPSLTTYPDPYYLPSDHQPYERMIVGFYRCKNAACNPFNDNDIEWVWDSGNAFSPDIPEPMDFLPFASTTPVSGSITLDKPVDLVVFYHAAETDNGRICGFKPGKPRTPSNYFCPYWTQDGRPVLNAQDTESHYDTAQSLGLAWPPKNGVWQGWNHSVVPACVALKRSGVGGSDITHIRAKPF